MELQASEVEKVREQIHALGRGDWVWWCMSVLSVLMIGAGALGLLSFVPQAARGGLSLPIAVLVFIAVFGLLAYFGLFTALTASTPGLLLMGLEVRNFDGALPTPGESMSRAFGYLVSIAALMLGFFWAVVDSEGLTWHDRISGTFITDRGSRFGIRGPA